MCSCMTWARTPEMTEHGGKYPPALHHPNCEDFKIEKFAKFSLDGCFCVMEPSEVESTVSYCDGSDYEVETVMLTRDQFENMPEFNGF